MRAFVGIPVIENDLAEFALARTHIMKACPEWTSEKWVPPENLHLTLKFLGDIDFFTLDRLADGLSEQIMQGSFRLPSRSVDAHPKPAHARMIWTGFLDPEGQCAALHHAVDIIAAREGIASEQRTFNPHVTLVRARRPKRIPSDVLCSASDCVHSMSVLGVTVYISTLTSRGARYEKRAHVPLRID